MKINTVLDLEQSTWRCEHIDGVIPCTAGGVGLGLMAGTEAARTHVATTGHPVTVQEHVQVRYEAS